MGGAVQSFSSPMLAQGMQGGLSGFGTSGLGTFADGGQTTTIQDILAKYKAMESAKAKQDPTTEFLNKSWEGKNIDDYIMYSDKYKRGGKMAKGGIFEHGLQEGDKIVKQVDEKYLIVSSKGGVYSVVDIEKGSRFIVGLDDSKTSGKRKSVKAGVKEAMEYINYVKSTKMANGGKFAQGGMLEDAKIYVADLAEYNNGRLVGKWLDLSDYSSGAEVMEAIQEMLDEQTKKDKFGDVHEEYAIHDFEGFPRSFYSEYMGESDFDQLYEIAKVADDANLPLDVLMKAMSDLGYEDNAKRVADEYSSSIPASMGNEWRDFAYEWVDSVGIEGVSNIESYFDYEEFGSDIRMDYSEEELEEMGYDDLSDEELGERNVEEIGGVENLPKKTLEMYFDYAKLGRDLQYDYTAIRGNDGDFYFFNRNFAKGGKVKYAKGGEVNNTRFRVLVRNSSSNEFREGAYFIEASSKERAEKIALAKFKKEFGTKRGVSVFVHSIKEVPMENGKERTRKYFVKMRNRKGSEKDNFIIDAFEETTALRRAFSKFRKKYNRPSAFDDNQEEFSIAVDDIYPIDEIKENGKTTYKRTFAKGGTLEVRGDSLDEVKKQAKLISKNWKKNTYVLETTSRNFTNNNKTRIYTWGDDEDVDYIKSITHDMRENITILMRYNNGILMSAEEEIIYKSPSLQNSDESKYAKGGEVKGAKFYTIFSDEDGDEKTEFDNFNDALADFNYFENEDANIALYEVAEKHKLLKKHKSSADIQYLELSNGQVTLSLEKEGGKWIERDVLSGEQPNGWGSKTYMGYLKPKDIASYLMRDYGGNFKIIEQYAKGGKVGAYSAWTIGQDLSHLPNKYYFLYNQDSGVRKGFYSTKKEANEAMAKYGYLAKGGKIGFEGLSKKVAKRYVGKKVSKEYQAEYGKTYDAKEAKEVGNKVAGKVYKQQVAKKKIVRKLQRKTK